MCALPDTDKTAKRRRNRRRRVIVYGSIAGLLVGFYYYQPNRIDFIPRSLPKNNPRLDPDSKNLFKKGTRVAIVTAHPDDAEFFLGGTLTMLGRTSAGSHHPHRVHERRQELLPVGGR